MRHELKALLARVDQVCGVRPLANLVVAECGTALRADAVGFYLYPETVADSAGADGLAKVVGLPAAFGVLYEQVGRCLDPVLAEVTETHAAVSSDDLLSVKGWHSHPLYRQVSGQFGLEHIMTAPLIGPGGVIGTVNAGRRSLRDSFQRCDLAAISAVAAHASVALAVCERSPAPRARLTPREWQIVQLVVSGRTNAGVGRRLGITENTVKQALKTVFRKTGARCRAELATIVATW